MRLSFVVKSLLQKEKRLRIIILGADNAGKTSILRSFMNQNILDIAPTFGYQIVDTTCTVGGLQYSVEFLDIGGQASIRAYWDTYYAGADGVLFVYDNYGSSEYMDILKATVSHPTLRHSAFICAANKVDDDSDSNKQGTIEIARHQIDEEVPFDFVASIKNLGNASKTEKQAIPIIYTSAKTGKNIKKIFSTLLETILKNRADHGLL
ncbi:ADP-ribosylation factor-like protein 2 [Nematocida displodere]|uniref:ADP-ribosylation factor-like protein 2 n=1 Tax=Nematocida displodere TaxID=1805483 RepID=A0A177EDB0_9MICR|nr:ADP-ribosylation factor-like protein 2 [Nematocida displodere]